MNFAEKSVRDVLTAINKLIDAKISTINTKKIRACLNISSSDRSQINFVWRTLKLLETNGLLENTRSNGVFSYKIVPKTKIDVDSKIKLILSNQKNPYIY